LILPSRLSYACFLGDPEPDYPEGWSDTGVQVRGEYVVLYGGDDMQIHTGWETTITFPKQFTLTDHPHVATVDFKEFAKGKGKKTSDSMTLLDLKDQKKFVMHGGYIRPYQAPKKKKPIPKKDAKKGQTKAQGQTQAKRGLFDPPANDKRRADASSTSSPAKKSRKK
jgi:hypothetical protein